MNYNNDFKYDLEVGQLGEKKLADILENKKIEVKTDFQAQNTGNVFIEYKSRGKWSGIVTSTADYWCFIVSNHQFVLLSKSKTWQLARKYKDRKVRGGDDNTSVGVLVPLDALLSHSVHELT